MPTNDTLDDEHVGRYSVPLTHWCDECGHPITADAPGWIKTNPDEIAERRDRLADWYKRNPGPRTRLTAEALATKKAPPI